MFAVFVVGEVDGVGGVGDVESAQEPGDVEGVFVAFGGDFMARSVSVSAAWMVSPSSCSMSTQVALSGTKAEALVLSQSGARS